MTPLKPYWTLDLYHIYLDSLQRQLLYEAGIIDSETFKLHINQLGIYYKKWYINHINSDQIKIIHNFTDRLSHRETNGNTWKILGK